jgi:formimidoylglutamate deiminase
MSMALVRAAHRVGIGITLLPTLYMRSGFGATSLRPNQQRFASKPESISRLIDDVLIHTKGMANVNVGLAVHSLRAADAPAITELAQFARVRGLPVHIHIAEQEQEIKDEIEAATVACKAAPPPSTDIIFTDVYADGGWAWRN